MLSSSWFGPLGGQQGQTTMSQTICPSQKHWSASILELVVTSHCVHLETVRSSTKDGNNWRNIKKGWENNRGQPTRNGSAKFLLISSSQRGQDSEALVANKIAETRWSTPSDHQQAITSIIMLLVQTCTCACPDFKHPTCMYVEMLWFKRWLNHKVWVYIPLRDECPFGETLTYMCHPWPKCTCSKWVPGFRSWSRGNNTQCPLKVNRDVTCISLMWYALFCTRTEY